MDKTRRFPVRDALTVTTGRLMTARRSDRDNGIDGLYKILSWVAGVPMNTLTLGQAADEFSRVIKEQHPDMDISNADLERFDALLGATEEADRDNFVTGWISGRGLDPVNGRVSITRVVAEAS